MSIIEQYKPEYVTFLNSSSIKIDVNEIAKRIINKDKTKNNYVKRGLQGADFEFSLVQKHNRSGIGYGGDKNKQEAEAIDIGAALTAPMVQEPHPKKRDGDGKDRLQSQFFLEEQAHHQSHFQGIDEQKRRGKPSIHILERSVERQRRHEKQESQGA